MGDDDNKFDAGFDGLTEQQKLRVIFKQLGRVVAYHDSEKGTTNNMLNELEQRIAARLPNRSNGRIRDTLAEKLKLNIGTVCSVCSAVAVGTWIVVGAVNGINTRLDTLTTGRWSLTHMREWSHQLRDRNPTLVIPNPSEVKNEVDK